MNVRKEASEWHKKVNVVLLCSIVDKELLYVLMDIFITWKVVKSTNIIIACYFCIFWNLIRIYPRKQGDSR